MRIVHATSVHPWGDARIFEKMASTAAAEGHEVHLVALDSEPREFEQNGVSVHLLARPPTRGRLRRMTMGARNVSTFAKGLSPDVIHFHDPELLPWFVSSRSRVIYDAHEDLPRQISTKGWIPGPLRSPVAALAEVAENFGARRMSGIIAATPTIAARFPPWKTATVRNYPRPEELSETSEVPYRERPQRFVYIGGISLERGLAEMLDATRIVASQREAELILAGRLPEQLAPALLDYERYVFAWGMLGRPQVADLLGNARVGLCILHPTKNYPNSLPVKLFEYMAAGIPVIASNFPLWREIVEGNECGLCVDPLNVFEIADAMNWLLDHPKKAAEMGRRGREAVLSRYNWQSQVEPLLMSYRAQ